MTKKILLINDIPGYGKVAIPAMTPVLVHKGYEVFNLPTAVLSNTLNYGKFAMIDTTEYMRDAIHTWKEIGFKFDAISVGFIANDAQSELIYDFCNEQASAGVTVVTDPIMGDNGKLYNSVTDRRVETMKKIVSVADYIVPNMTEACFLSGKAYRAEGFDIEELRDIARTLHKLGAKSVIITSALVTEKNGLRRNAVVGYDHCKDACFEVYYEEIPVKINGSGDVFSAVILSEVIENKNLEAAVNKAVNSVRKLILDNIEVAGEYNGLPIESDMDCF